MNFSRGRLVGITLLAWLAFLAVDFFAHGVLLRGWYERGGPALLPLGTAFARIPFGYLSFLLLIGLFVWLSARLGMRGVSAGFGFGLAFGLVTSVSRALALYSITTLAPALLVWWAVAETVEFSVAGMVTGRALATRRLGRLAGIVGAGVLVTVVVGVVVQSL